MTVDSPARTPRAGAGPSIELATEWDAGLRSTDPLGFPGYDPPEPRDDSVRTGLLRWAGSPVAVIECRFARSGGTMGAVAGERVVRAFRRATQQRIPVVAVVSSGGARLQEGTVALAQMARTATAVSAHSCAGLRSAALLTHPTTGGVFASWASLTDLRAATPAAVIGFGGPRVVAEVTGALPPPDSHTTESAWRNGHLDAVVEEKDALAWLLAAVGAVAAPPLRLPAGRPVAPLPPPPGLDAWAAVGHVRRPDRPSGLEWAAWLTEGWVELHGRDPAIRAGVATVGGTRTVVVAMDRHAAPGGSRPGPAGFRLARRALALADRTGLPLLTLIDTAGADPSPAAESDDVAGEIARTLAALARTRVGTVGLCVGEGGSGGAMALAHTDRLLLLEGSVFPVIAPEAGAAILHRDRRQAPQLAARLRMQAVDLVGLGLADGIVAESVADVGAALAAAFATTTPGERHTRWSAATASALA